MMSDYIRAMLVKDHNDRLSVKFAAQMLCIIYAYDMSLGSSLPPSQSTYDAFVGFRSSDLLGSDGPFCEGFPSRNYFLSKTLREMAFNRYVQIYETRMSVMGDSHPSTLWSRARLIWACLDQSQYDRADLLLRGFPDEHALLMTGSPGGMQYALGSLAVGQGRSTDALRLYTEATNLEREAEGSHH
jgi:hypothetical protein